MKATQEITLSAAVTYALQVYQEMVPQVGPRVAYAAAVDLAGLRPHDRATLRRVISALAPS